MISKIFTIITVHCFFFTLHYFGLDWISITFVFFGLVVTQMNIRETNQRLDKIVPLTEKEVDSFFLRKGLKNSDATEAFKRAYNKKKAEIDTTWN